MVVEELITLIKSEIDPASIKSIEGFAGMAEAAFLGIVSAIAAIPTAVAAASAAMVGMGIQSAAKMEMTTAEMTTMLAGNEQQAKALIGTIREFANATPFETAPLVENAKTMMGMGVAAGDTVKYMKMIGDVAGGNQDKLNHFVYNFSQIKSLGKMQGEDFRTFAAGGFNPLKALTQDREGKSFSREDLEKKVKAGTMSMETFRLVVGKTDKQLQEMMSKGKIGFQQVEDAFKMATAKGGLFYGNLDRMSKATLGRLSTMTDAFKTQLLDIGNKFLPLVGRALDSLARMLDYIGPLWVAIVDDMRVFFTAFSDSGPEDWIQNMTIGLEVVLGVTADLIYMFTFLFKMLKVGFMQFGLIATEAVRFVFKGLWNGLIMPFELLISLISTVADAAGLKGISEALDSATGSLDKFREARTDAVDNIANSWGVTEDSLAKNMMEMNFAYDQIGKKYTPRVNKPPIFNQNNNIKNEVTIDPKADASGRTSLHMKGLKEAVRSAFNIEIMQILGAAKGV